ncbi:hypothetical protein IVA98_33130 [Bradyrhizobium sp. 160]|nr:hypothetical protein [Bradyrhizobium sp. 160]
MSLIRHVNASIQTIDFTNQCVLGNHLDLRMSATTTGIVPALSGVLPAYLCI